MLTAKARARGTHVNRQERPFIVAFCPRFIARMREFSPTKRHSFIYFVLPISEDAIMWQAQLQGVPDFLKHIDWPNWLAIVGLSSAVSAVVVLSMQTLRDRIAHRRERRDAALEVAVALEGYARLCRAMMHRAEWALAEMTNTGNRAAARSVTLPAFVFPERIQWRRLGHKAVSGLRDFPARIHAGREDLGSFSEYGDAAKVCEEVALESAKAARDALALARVTRKQHGCVPWRPGSKDADLNRDLAAFIASAEEKRNAPRERKALNFPAAPAASAASANDPRIAMQ
jgi:hypothetical protein